MASVLMMYAITILTFLLELFSKFRIREPLLSEKFSTYALNPDLLRAKK